MRLDGSKKFGGKVEGGKENPYSAVVLGGARTQKERQSNLASFKDGDIRFLICTDVAARGLDIAGLPFVIQMTLPDDIENYIHRIGRCGRADHMGLAISLVATEKEKVWYHKCVSKGKNCIPAPGNTKLGLPFGVDGKCVAADENRWLVDEGGCAVWYDESELLKKTQTRVGNRIETMDPDDFGIHGIIESPLPMEQRKNKVTEEDMEKEEPSRRGLKRKQDAPKAVVKYGARRKDPTLVTQAKQAHALAPVVTQLSDLEVRAQQLFARMMWGAYSDSQQMTLSGKKQAKPEGVVLAPTGAGVAPAVPPAKPAEKPKKKMRW